MVMKGKATHNPALVVEGEMLKGNEYVFLDVRAAMATEGMARLGRVRGATQFRVDMD
jgi:hypothetical protein